MAKTFGAVLGKQSGRIGQIVGRVTRGKQYFAALPTVAKDRKVSSKEQDVRLKFKTLTQLAKGFKQGIKVSLERYAKYAPYITPYNHFVKINKDTVHVEGGVAEIEYGAILLAPEGGDIPAVGFSAASFDEPLRVSVAFTPNSDVPMADADDNVYLFVYEPESGQGILSRHPSSAAPQPSRCVSPAPGAASPSTSTASPSAPAATTSASAPPPPSSAPAMWGKRLEVRLEVRGYRLWVIGYRV